MNSKKEKKKDNTKKQKELEKQFNTKDIKEKQIEEDNEWIKMLEEDLDKFSLGSSNEDNEEEKEIEIIEEDDAKPYLHNNQKLEVEEKSEIEKKAEIKEPNTQYKDEKTRVIITTKKQQSSTFKDNNAEIENKNIIATNDSIFFEGKEYKKYSRYNTYNSKRKIKKIIYKCINIRKDDRIRRATNQPVFCNATIEYIEPGQNIKSGYFIKYYHSEECDEMNYRKSFEKIKDKIEKEEGKEQFINLCNEVMDTSTIYDRRLYKEEFKKIYNKGIYKFPINDNFLSNIITKWKKTSDRFTKRCIFKNKYDYDNKLILRDYRVIPINENNKISSAEYEYIIWGNNENILRMRQSKHFFIDGTFHHPEGFTQLLILMYKDVISSIKIPGLYILVNSKKEMLYNYTFNGILDLLTANGSVKLMLETIVTDQEKAMINVVRNTFQINKEFHVYFIISKIY